MMIGSESSESKGEHQQVVIKIGHQEIFHSMIVDDSDRLVILI